MNAVNLDKKNRSESGIGVFGVAGWREDLSWGFWLKSHCVAGHRAL